MTSRRHSVRTLVRAAFCVFPAVLGLAFLSGCDDGYDATSLYPPRTDWLVENLPKIQPTRINPPGIHPLQSLSLTTNYFGPDQDLLKAERDGGNIHNPLDLPDQVRNNVAYVLRDLAGRPRVPKIDINHLEFEQTNKDLIKELKLDRKTLAEGSKLFRKQCLHCHGVAGDGKGPTGMWVNPHPRDYRQGIFKFTSPGNDQGVRKPRREDLRRVLTNGIEGTSMPSFRLLKLEEIDALMSYVIHLSIRGEAEYWTLIDLCKNKKDLDYANADLKDAESKGDQGRAASFREQIKGLEEELAGSQADRVRGNANMVGQRWLESQKALSVPTADLAKKFEEMTDQQRLESAKRGYEVFTDKDKGNCIQCHTNLGRDSDYRYDAWATIVKPRNLVANNLRGGRRPIDLYWRIRTGINGSGMPALITSEADLKTKEPWIWDLVNFIQMVPYADKRVELKKLGVKFDFDGDDHRPAKAEHQ